MIFNDRSQRIDMIELGQLRDVETPDGRIAVAQVKLLGSGHATRRLLERRCARLARHHANAPAQVDFEAIEKRVGFSQ